MESYADFEGPHTGELRDRSYSRTPPRRSYDEEDDRTPPPRDAPRRSPPPRSRNDRDSATPAKPRHAPKDVNPTNIVGVFGLSIRTLEKDLEEKFGRIAPVEKVVIVYDARTERSRGFGFVTMVDIEAAKAVIEALNGIELHGRKIRVDFSATKRPHSPTPGEYRGSIRQDDRYRGGPGGPGAWGPPPPRGGWGGWAPPPPRHAGGWGGGYGRYPPPPDRWGPPPPPRRGYGADYDGYGYERSERGGYGGGYGPEGSDDWRRRATPPRRGGRDISPPFRSRRHRDDPSPPPRRRDSRTPPPRRRDDD